MVTSLQLPNGLTVICEERPKTGKVAMQVTFRAGSIHESTDENGLTSLMQESCWGGTATRSRNQIANDIESRGGQFSSDTSRTQTWFAAQSLARETDAIFAVLADAIRNPAFRKTEIEKTREQVIISLDQAEQKASGVARSKFYEAAFSGQPAGSLPAGTKQSLKSFTPAQIRQKHADILSRPENIVISFVGDIDAAAAKNLAEKYFHDLKPGTKTPAPRIHFTGGDLRSSNKNEQLSLTFGFEAPAQTDPKRFDMIMLEELLSGGMSSPLFQEIREKRGLVYSVGADYMPLPSSGVFSISAGTGKGNAAELMSVTFDLLGQIAAKGFTDSEMRRARERIIRGIKGGMESDESACHRYATQILNFGRLIPLEEHEAQLARVKSVDVQSACAAMLRRGAYALGGVGPQDNMPQPQEIEAAIAKAASAAPVFKTAPRPALTMMVSFAKASAAPEPLSGPPKVTVLKNGMKVVTAERPGSLACGAWVGAGSDHETPELNGATHMNEHMMFKGTPSYGPGQIDRIIEGELGGDLNAYTDRDKTAYYFYNLLAKDIEKIVDICGEMVFQANLDHEEYDGKTTLNADGTITKNKGERDVVVEEIKRANDNVGSRLWDMLASTAYSGQAHSRPILGTESTLRAMTVEALAAYRDAYYVPNNVVFSAAGPVKHEDFVALIEKKFGHMPPVPFTPLPEQRAKGGVGYDETEAAQICELVFAVNAVPEQHPDHLAYEALGEILGGGGSSRFYKTLVNKAGLTNAAWAGMASYFNSGLFVAGLATEAKNAKEALRLIYADLRSAASSMTNAELNKVKAQMEMAALSGIETNNDACDTYAKDVLGSGKACGPQELSEKIRQLTLADVKRVARDILAAEPILAGVIPQGTDRTLLPDYKDLLALRGNTAGTSPKTGPKPGF